MNARPSSLKASFFRSLTRLFSASPVHLSGNIVQPSRQEMCVIVVRTAEQHLVRVFNVLGSISEAAVCGAVGLLHHFVRRNKEIKQNMQATPEEK